MTDQEKENIAAVVSLLSQHGIGFMSACSKGMFEFEDSEEILEYLEDPQAFINNLEAE